jgi:hypothetical protein
MAVFLNMINLLLFTFSYYSITCNLRTRKASNYYEDREY